MLGTPQDGRPMVRFALKLKALKRRLKVWNKDVFGNINQAINLAEDEVIRTENAYDSFPSEYNTRLLCQAKKI